MAPAASRSAGPQVFYCHVFYCHVVGISVAVHGEDPGCPALGKIDHSHRRGSHRDPIEQVKRLTEVMGQRRLDRVGVADGHDRLVPVAAGQVLARLAPSSSVLPAAIHLRGI